MAKHPNRLNLADKLAAELAANPVTSTPPRDSDRTNGAQPNVSLASATTAPPDPQITDDTHHLSQDSPTQKSTRSPDHLTTDPPDQWHGAPPPSEQRHPQSPHITASPAPFATDHLASVPSSSPSSGQPAAQTDGPEREGQGANGRTRPSSIKPCRVDVMRVSGFFSERVKYQIQQLQWKYSHTTEEEMVGQALNLLFRYEGMPEIAFEGKDTRKRPITLRPPQE